MFAVGILRNNNEAKYTQSLQVLVLSKALCRRNAAEMSVQRTMGGNYRSIARHRSCIG